MRRSTSRTRTSKSSKTSTTWTTTTISTSEISEPLLLGLGSNVGDSVTLLRWAIGELGRRFGPFRVAPFYRSAPLSPISQPDFVNTVILRRLAASEMPAPEDVLVAAKSLEQAAGRRPGPRWGPRPLDIDLLLCGARHSDLPELTLPHPRLRERRFVLAPLADLAPDLALPGDGARVADLLAALGEDQEVERLGSMETL